MGRYKKNMMIRNRNNSIIIKVSPTSRKLLSELEVIRFEDKKTNSIKSKTAKLRIIEQLLIRIETNKISIIESNISEVDTEVILNEFLNYENILNFKKEKLESKIKAEEEAKKAVIKAEEAKIKSEEEAKRGFEARINEEQETKVSVKRSRTKSRGGRKVKKTK